MRVPFNSADEQDALTPSRKFYIWKAKQLKKIKRRYNKRVRALAKKEINDGER